MRNFFSIFMVALAMTAMVGCDKDKDKDNDNTAAEAAANMAVIDGRSYHLNCRYSIEQNGRGYLDGESTEQQDGVASLNIRGDVTQTNRTYDLTHYVEDGDYAFGVTESNSENPCNFQQDNHVDGEPHFYGVINEQEYSDGAFQSGTLTVSRTDALLTYKLTGVLKNGKSVSFHASVPASDWEYLSW